MSKKKKTKRVEAGKGYSFLLGTVIFVLQVLNLRSQEDDKELGRSS